MDFHVRATPVGVTCMWPSTFLHVETLETQMAVVLHHEPPF